MTTVTLDPLAFYAAHGAALFPLPYGEKNPGNAAFWPSPAEPGRAGSFKHDCSRDPAVWRTWPTGCNFGVVGFASRWIICDIDTKQGRDAAWSAWCALCSEWGIPVAMPHVNSARGGWHVYFSLPAGVDAATLRQPDAIRGIINIRCVGYTVAAGSFYDGTAKGEESGAYVLLSDAAPYPAPAALIEHCTPRAADPAAVAKVGQYDTDDIEALIDFLTDKDEFANYDEWVRCGMALRVEMGDGGFPVWERTFDETVTDVVSTTKWQSFSTEPKPGGVTVASLMKRAHALGWTGQLRRPASAMFDGVAAIASAAGARLSSAPTGAVPLADTQQTVAALGQPLLDEFLAGTRDVPHWPLSTDHPKLPEALGAHPLYDLMSAAIGRTMAMAEDAKSFRFKRVERILALLSAMHPPTFAALCQRITALGGLLAAGSLDSAVKRFENEVRREHNTATGFIVDTKGAPVANNTDNIRCFMRERAVRLRQNTWKACVEIADTSGENWQQLTDDVFGDLIVDANNSHFNYHPPEGLFKRGLVALARENPFDPVRERVDGLRWDGTARLDQWLSYTCGVPLDDYHVAVGRNLIGGLVRRARYPGCAQAETVIFISQKQGTGKSTLCEILALDSDWYTDSFKLGGRQQDSIPQLFGKWVVELGELAGMNQTEVEEVKAFLSSKSDNYTAKYEAFAKDHKRRVVFIGTSNDVRPLRDVSGGRRFLPVHVHGEVNTDWLRANVEQIIAEAAHLDAAGQSFAIPRSVWELAGQHQEAARAMSPVEELCIQWLDVPDREGGYFVTAEDIGRALRMAGQSQHARYTMFMDKLGWLSNSLIVPGTARKSRMWVKGTGRLETAVRLEPVQTVANGRVEFRMSMTRPPTG